MKVFNFYLVIISNSIKKINLLVVCVLFASGLLIEKAFSQAEVVNNEEIDYRRSLSNESGFYDDDDETDNDSLADETELDDSQASDVENDDDLAGEEALGHSYSIKQAIDEVYGSIFTRSRTKEELISYLNTLAPDDSGLEVGVSYYVAKLHQNSIYNRIMGARNNYNTIKCQSLDFYKNNKLDIWGMTAIGKAHKQSIEKTTGYKDKSNHLVTGIDRYISSYILGFAVGFDRSLGGTFTPENIKRDQQMLQNSFLFSVYAASYIVNNLFCSAIASVGYCKVEASRLRDEAKMNSNYGARFNKYNISASYEFNLFMLNIEPEVVSRLTTISVDAYQNIPENNRIKKTEGEFHYKINDYVFDVGVGVSFTQTWILSECFITPKIKSTFYRNMNKTPTVFINTAFMQDSYKSDVVNKQANILDTEVGLDISFKKVNLSIYYNVSNSNYYSDNSLVIKANMSF